MKFNIPKEGAPMWFDMIAIPKDAKHPKNAHLFLDYIMRPEVMAGISNSVAYANANKASTPLVDKEVLDNPERLSAARRDGQAVHLRGAAAGRATAVYTRLWTKLKTGQLSAGVAARSTERAARVAVRPPALTSASRVTKKFGDFDAVDDVSLDIRQGELFALLGRLGLRQVDAAAHARGLRDADRGRIEIDGQDMTGLPPYERPTNMMFQCYALFPHMTVEQNVAYGLYRDGMRERGGRATGSPTCWRW